MPRKKSTSLIGKLIKWTWIAFFSMVVLVIVTLFSVRINLFDLFGELPSYKSMENPEAENDLASILISADGIELGKYYRFNRNQVTFDKLSPHLVDALLSTEDIRFLRTFRDRPEGTAQGNRWQAYFYFQRRGQYRDHAARGKYFQNNDG
jgi:membrane peptidoglycan carboxypeptidase